MVTSDCFWVCNNCQEQYITKMKECVYCGSKDISEVPIYYMEQNRTVDDKTKLEPAEQSTDSGSYK